MEKILQLLLFPGRLRFRWRNRKRLSITESLKKTIYKRCEDAQRAGLKSYVEIYNVGLFISLIEQDISAYNEAIYFAKSEWQRKFYARHLAILLHEATEDIAQLLGKSYRNHLKDIGLKDQWFDELNKIGKKISAFQRDHGKFLGEIRNYVAAHRDHDAMKQMQLMDSFSAFDVYRVCGIFSEPLRDIVQFYMSLLTYMHNPIVMIREVTKSIDKSQE